MTEVVLGCGDAWLVGSGLTADRLLCLTCCAVQPVVSRRENATTGRLARVLGGKLIIETVEAR